MNFREIKHIQIVLNRRHSARQISGMSVACHLKTKQRKGKKVMRMPSNNFVLFVFLDTQKCVPV